MSIKVTRNDVAKLADVSPAVVSYVINGSNYVSAEKRKAVQAAISQLHYTPNVFAQSLRAGRSNQIALIGDSLEADLFRKLSEKLYENGFYSSLYYSIIDDEFVQRLISMRYDAIFMTSNRFSTEQLNRIAESGIPIVLYQSHDYGTLNDHIVVLVPDFFDSIKKSVDYLVLKGHKRIAFIPPLKYQTKGVEGHDYRARAFVSALKTHNLEVEPNFFSIHTESVERILADVFEMITVYDKDTRPTAFVVGEDHLAARLMQYLRMFNLEIPKDMAIVGWGNGFESKVTTPLLTTVDYDIASYAQKVNDAIISLLSGKRPKDEQVPVKLVIREST